MPRAVWPVAAHSELDLTPTSATVRWHTHADSTAGGAYDNDLVGTFRFLDAITST
jgi:hypothetical protein